MEQYKKIFSEQDDPKKKMVLWDGTSIKVVNGEEVRNDKIVEFAGGGHGYVYKEIPKDEIWVEHMVSKEDMQDILIHEITEYIFMKYAQYKYEDAHKIANDIEQAIRTIK
jgi:hypothetical protein